MEFFLVRIFPYLDWIRTRKNSIFGLFSRSSSEKVYPVLEHSGHFLLVMFLTFWQGCCRALQTKDLVGFTLKIRNYDFIGRSSPNLGCILIQYGDRLCYFIDYLWKFHIPKIKVLLKLKKKRSTSFTFQRKVIITFSSS